MGHVELQEPRDTKRHILWKTGAKTMRGDTGWTAAVRMCSKSRRQNRLPETESEEGLQGGLGVAGSQEEHREDQKAGSAVMSPDHLHHKAGRGEQGRQ